MCRTDLNLENNMKGTMNIEMIGENIDDNIKHSGIQAGTLKLPEGFSASGGGLIAVGENEMYLHCFMADGTYCGVFKSNEKDHLYQHLLALNT